MSHGKVEIAVDPEEILEAALKLSREDQARLAYALEESLFRVEDEALFASQNVKPLVDQALEDAAHGQVVHLSELRSELGL